MKPPSFAYHTPKTVEEAVAILARVAADDGRVIAGGQSLIPIMNFRLAAPGHLVDINGIEALSRLREERGVLIIPACVRHAAFENSADYGTLGRLLADVASHIAHRPIRVRGTFCGSLAHADPSSEWCLAAVTLGAELILKSVRGERHINADAFLTGAMTNVLAPDELLLEARLKLLAENTRFGFWEVSRRAGDFAMASCLAVWRIENGAIKDMRIGVGGAEAIPRRIPEAETTLAGRIPSGAAFAEAAEIAANALDEILEDARNTAEFRRDLVRAVVRRALERGSA